MTDRASAEGLRAEYGETAMDGPNTHKMDAPFDVTSWTVIPTTRDVPSDDGRRMEPRNEWWHIPTFVVEAIEDAALRDTGPRPDNGIDAAFAFLRKRLVGTPPNVDMEDAWMASLLDEAEALARLSTPRTETPDD